MVAVEDDLEGRLRAVSHEGDEAFVGRDPQEPCGYAAQRSLPRRSGWCDRGRSHVGSIIGDGS
jgi:hypothetical protein